MTRGLPAARPRRSALARLVRGRPTALAALFIIAAALAAALLADAIAPHDPLAPDIARRLEPPGPGRLLGADNFGRDVLSRVIYGARTSLAAGLLSASAAAAAGVLIGAASAMLGGWTDLIVQRITDAFTAFPAVVWALVFAAAFGPSVQMVTIALIVALAPQMVRLMRAKTLEIKEEEYVTAARAAGASGWRIVFRHILPNAAAPAAVLATGFVGEALALEAALSYLGLGVPPPHPSWGRMIYEGAHLYLETAPWLTVFPGLALALVALAFAWLGDALRNAFDPRDARSRGLE